MPLKRVYFDHWFWIELEKIAKGAEKNPALEAILEVARHGSRAGWLSFPLSLVHYMELSHGSSVRQRYEIGDLMHELSRGHRMIAPTDDLVRSEFDAALKRRFGVPLVPKTTQVFGVGGGHALGTGPIVGRIVPREGYEGEDIDPILKARLEAWANDLMERMLLSGPPEGIEVPGYDANAHRVVADEFVLAEKDQAARFHARAADTEYQRRALLAREWIGLGKIVLGALIEARIEPERFLSQGAEFLADFMADMPVVHAALEMRRLQHQNPERSWSANDLYDVQALSMAVVHCDAVVTEKYWAHMIRRAKLDERHSTLVVDRKRLGELLDFLVRGEVRSG